MKPCPKQNLTADKKICNYRHSRAGRISNRWRIYFTTINLEPKIVKDVVLTMLILHKMLIRSPDSSNVYRPASLVDHVGENGNLIEGQWRKNITGDGILSTYFKHPEVNTKQK